MGTGQVVNITINVQDATGGAVVEQVIAQLQAIGPAAQAAGAEATAGLAGVEAQADRTRVALAGLSASWKGVFSGGPGTAGTNTAFQGQFLATGTSQWSQFKNAAQSATQEVSDGLDKVGGHALTSLDNVRLLRDDLGIRIPRSMERAIASSALLSGAINSVGSGLLAIGALDIFVRLGEGAYKFYENFIDLDSAQKEFQENQRKAKDADFVNVHSIETARVRIDEATAATKNLNNAAQAFSSLGWSQIFGGVLSGNYSQISAGVGNVGSAHQFSQGGAQSAAQVQELTVAQNNMSHQLALAQIDAAHAADGSLKGQAKITEELSRQLEINKENARYATIEDKQRGNTAGATHDSAMLALENQKARAQAAAQSVELSRQERDQVIQMQNEAVNAGIEGNALRAAQEQQEINSITRKYQEGELGKQAAIEETAAVRKKYANQAMMQQEALDEQTRQMADEASQAGLKGNPLVQAQMWSKLQSIDAAEQKAVGAGGFEPDAMLKDYESQRASARAIANQKMTESDEQFNDRVRELTDSSASYQSQGYARVEAETRKHLETLDKYYEDQYGNDRNTWAGYQAAKTEIESEADRQREQLHERTMLAIQKEEEQAARLSLPDWQQSRAAIVDTYNERLRQIQQDVQLHVMTEQEGAAAVRAAWATEQAQMQRDAQQTRDKLASTLGDFFNDPGKYVEKRAMDTAFQMMANDMMAYFQKNRAGSGMLQWLFGMGPEMSTSTNPGTDIKSILGMGGSGTGLTNVGVTLSAAGTQLTSAGTMQVTAANALITAASSLESASSTLAFGGSGGGIPSGAFDLAGSTSSGLSDAGAGFAGASTSDFNFGSPSMIAGGAAGDYSTSLGTGDMQSQLGQTSGLGSVGGNTGKVMGAVGGAITAGFGIYNAYENSDPLGGLLSGAIGGAEIGALGGPVGMAIGAAVGGVAGLLAGLFGDHGEGKAKDYDKNTVQPGLAKELRDFDAGRAGYNQAARDLDQLMTQAKSQTSGWGSGARRWFSDHISPEIDAAVQSLNQQERNGRSQITMSAAQYHTGGWVGGFGDFDLGGGEGFAKLLRDEYVVHPMAARAHGPLVEAINAGNVSYARNPQPRMPASSGDAGGVTLVIKALDSKDVSQWAKGGGGRALVAAMNQAQRSYSGVGRG